MSRDFTPRDMILEEEKVRIAKGILIRDISWSLGGTGDPSHRKKWERLHRTYPELTFLMDDMEALDDIAISPWAREFLVRTEKRLSRMKKQAIDGTLPKPEEHDILARWYSGTLVPGYCMDENAAAFTQWMEENIRNCNEAFEISKERKKMRISKIEYYLNIAREVSRRSTCLRRNYGCVIVKNDEIIATGYNGAARGEANCCDIHAACPRSHTEHNSGNYGDCPAVHAEQNAMISASRKDMIGADMYLAGFEHLDDGTVVPMQDCEPCPICARMIKNAGIARVFGHYEEESK